jgi:pSer/pThr/pTyr-binding forkhead associated (FHA) protein
MGYSVELPRGDTVVGRDVNCSLRFNDGAISRRHMRITREGDDVFLEDMGSTNGTELNGTIIEGRTQLSDRDTIRVGEHYLQVRFTDDDADQPSTRRLAKLADLGGIKKTVRAPRLPPSRQRCPRCGMAISASDRECANCGYTWAGFRAGTPTLRPIDRRRHDRRPVELQLIYKSTELEIEATTRDLSKSGVFVCTQVLDPLGTQCELTILVDGGPPLLLTGVVRRVVERDEEGDSIGLGIEFVDVKAAEKAWLELAVAHLSDTGLTDIS